ncbi:hypothetical protein LguiA_022239 [Lonicera macranthoides]
MELELLKKNRPLCKVSFGSKNTSKRASFRFFDTKPVSSQGLSCGRSIEGEEMDNSTTAIAQQAATELYSTTIVSILLICIEKRISQTLVEREKNDKDFIARRGLSETWTTHAMPRITEDKKKVTLIYGWTSSQDANVYWFSSILGKEFISAFSNRSNII